jgi:hypothetical protein
MTDPTGGIQPPIHLWWDLPTDDVGPWWVLPGVGAPVHVRHSHGFDQSAAVQGTERFRLEQRFNDVSGLRVGDTVAWIQPDPSEPGEVIAVYPQRVVQVREYGEGQEVWTLVDAKLGELGDYPLDVDPVGWIAAGQVTHQHMRDLLELFQLNVICPNCATPGQQVLMGMPAGPPDPWVDLGGCVVGPGEPLASYRCVRCEAGWYVAEDGELVITSTEGRIPVWATDGRNPWTTPEDMPRP